MQDALNPASRLHVLLKSALQGDPNEQMLSVWATLFDVPKANEMDVVRCLIGMSDCLDEAKRLLGTRAGINLALYTSEFSSIEAAIAPSALRRNRGQTLVPHLQPTVLTRLEFCAEEIRRFYKEEPVPEADLSSIQGLVDDLFNEIYGSDLEAQLRLVLLEELEKLRAALVMYRIRGVKGLADSCRSLVGTVATHGAAMAAASSEARPLLARFGGLIKQVADVTSSAMTIYKSLREPINAVLGLLGYDGPPGGTDRDTPPQGGSEEA